MPTYKEIQQQITKLQQEAEALRKQEIASVVADIRKKMLDYNLSPSDLGLKAPGTKYNARKDGPKGEPKYRDPATGATWTGKGKAPRWIKEYEATGKGKEDLRI